MTPERTAVLDFLDRKTLAQILAGFAVAGAVLYLVVSFVGTRDVLGRLAMADPLWVAAACVSTLLCLAAWGKAWQVVLAVSGVEEPYHRLLVTFFAATFANYVTPMGQAGGEPFIAYVLSRDTDASYEDSLASVVTADALNLLPFFTFAGLGFAALVWQATLPERIEPFAGALVALALGLPLACVVGWRFRRGLARRLLGPARPIIARVPVLSVADLRQRLFDLEAAFKRIAKDRRALVYALCFSYFGWLCFALPLYFAGQALAVPLSALLVLFVVPASTLAGLAPSPGGSGAVVPVLALLLVAVAGVTGTTATAVAIVYRVTSYLVPILVGGAAALYVIRRA